MRDDVVIAHRQENGLASRGSFLSAGDRHPYFFGSSGFEAGGGVGLVSAGLTGAGAGAMVGPGVAAPPPAGVSSPELQPVTRTSASTRLESIVQVLIPDFAITDALLEKHETR